MPTRDWFLIGAALVALGVGGTAGQTADYPFVFRDVGDEAGVFPRQRLTVKP